MQLSRDNGDIIRGPDYFDCLISEQIFTCMLTVLANTTYADLYNMGFCEDCVENVKEFIFAALDEYSPAEIKLMENRGLNND